MKTLALFAGLLLSGLLQAAGVMPRDALPLDTPELPLNYRLHVQFSTPAGGLVRIGPRLTVTLTNTIPHDIAIEHPKGADPVLRVWSDGKLIRGPRDLRGFTPEQSRGRPVIEPAAGGGIASAWLQPLETSDHAALVSGWNDETLAEGREIYSALCVACHGTREQQGSLPTALRFAEGAFKNGSDPYSMYVTLTRGFGQMVPQGQYTTREKYSVIQYIRETFIKPYNPSQFTAITPAYLETLPKSLARVAKERITKLPPQYERMDFGPALFWTFQVEPGNIAYKAIAIRLDAGDGGVSKGKAWMVYDHDTMRVAAGTSGSFVDWKGIAFDGSHQTHTSLTGERHFVNPVGPGVAGPAGEWNDPRLRGRDQLPYGPLPREWAHYKGLYLHGDRAVVSMTVGGAPVLESPGWLDYGATPVFFRTVNVGQAERPVVLRIAPTNSSVSLAGAGRLRRDGGFWVAELPSGARSRIAISRVDQASLDALATNNVPSLDLGPLTRGGPIRWIHQLEADVKLVPGDGPFQVEHLELPEANPWNCWMRPGGFDFLPGENGAVVSTWNGDLWRVTGLKSTSRKIIWKRIASGLFQPLGVKLRNGEIFVTCRDQLVRLKDLNGDGEADFIENFNNDHQVTEHFHEFAMGLQTDNEGNFYYAKSARHALPALVPHHGTLLRVSRDGSRTDIVASGFRAANGVCLNEDGSFFVTDQEGHWTPKNRINRVQNGGFYGNLFGYTSITNTLDDAMEQPMVWITNVKDRSPAELLWVPRDQWGPLGGTLLNLSYGTGRIFAVPHERVNGRWQGAVCELPIPAFADGVMRGRFTADGSLYAAGMFAWAGNATAPGGFHRIRYTGKPAGIPLQVRAGVKQIEIQFSDALDPASVQVTNCSLKVWSLKRSANYGSKHHDEHLLAVQSVRISSDNRTVTLDVPGLVPTQCYELVLKLRGADGSVVERNLHGTIHETGQSRASMESAPEPAASGGAGASGPLPISSGLLAGIALADPVPPADAAAGAASKKKGPLLDLERLFNSDEFSGESLGTFVWSRRRPGYYTLDNAAAGTGGKDLVWNAAEGGKKEIVVPAQAFIPPGETKPLSLDDFEFSADESKLLIFTNSKRVWRRNTRGDYWVLDIAGRDLRKLGGEAAASSLYFAKFSPDGTRVAYVHENNLHVQDLRSLAITRLTSDGSTRIINGTTDWVYEEELDLRDAYRWSPDGRSIAYWQLDTTGVPEFHLVNNTDGLYSRVTTIPYPKVGQQNSSARVGVVSASGGSTRWLQVPGDPRNHYIAQMEWKPDSSQLLLQQFNRLQNTNRVMAADPADGGVKDLFSDSDPAWLENDNPVRWIQNGKQFLWINERSGWRHAWMASSEGGQPVRIHQENHDLIAIEAVDEKGGWLYYAASPANATQRYLHRVPLKGGPSERITPAGQEGWHTYNISPDAAWAVHTFSSFDTPPVVELIRLSDHKVERVLVKNQKLRENLKKLRLPKTEFLKVDIGGGTMLDAWAIQPLTVDRRGRHPLFFHVYGEPHGQTVRDVWNGQRGLWHRMLAQQGYIVASVDNRGTMSPRGREFRKVVYKQLGILPPQDQAAAVKTLLKRWPHADPARVGIWGWSGGGSMSLNAILQYPGIYQMAMAVAPVPNQRLYDSIYQERYMGSPDENSEGYRRGSPLTYAAQLRGKLLLVHGTGDDNCHYQGVEALMNELVTHNKQFTVMPYPNRTHSISEGANTTRHLFTLLTEYLNQNLPVKGRGARVER